MRKGEPRNDGNTYKRLPTVGSLRETTVVLERKLGTPQIWHPQTDLAEKWQGEVEHPPPTNRSDPRTA